MLGIRFLQKLLAFTPIFTKMMRVPNANTEPTTEEDSLSLLDCDILNNILKNSLHPGTVVSKK